MTNFTTQLLNEIDLFLSETGMGVSYFGKQATGNSEVVRRLRAGGLVWPETEKSIRLFIKKKRAEMRKQDCAA